MQAKHCKIKSYIGFAIKSGAIKYGVDDIVKCKKSKLILFSDTLAKSSTEKLLNFASTNKIDAIQIESDNFDLLFDGNVNIKAVAILDFNLALAIKKNMAK